MKGKRKLGLKQYIPTHPESLFQIIEPTPHLNYWHIKIRDAILNDEPEFRYYLPKSRANWPTPQRVANAGAGELNEARGLVTIQRFEDGIPVFLGIYASDSRSVYCLRCTDDGVKSVSNGGIAMVPPTQPTKPTQPRLPITVTFPESHYAILQLCEDKRDPNDIDWISADSDDELIETVRDLEAKVLWKSTNLEECERIVSLNRRIIEKLGAQRWQDVRRVLSFKGNFVSGYRIYVEAWSKPAQGKYFTEPCAVDKSIEWLIENEILRPSRLAIQPERAGAVGLIGYNAAYIKHTLPIKPIPGHYVDWDYEVMVEVLSPYV